jgi:hypothetical protein
MKQFLIDKLASYSTEMAVSFHLKLTNQMPTFRTKPATPTIWGNADDGVWAVVSTQSGGVLTGLEAFYYHNNGDIFSLSSQYDKAYFDMYQKLYVACVSQKPQTLRVMRPIEFETVMVNLGCLNTSQELNYIKFESPAGELGKICLDTLDINDVLKNLGNAKLILETLGDLLLNLKNLGFASFNRFHLLENILIDSQGAYLRLFPSPINEELEILPFTEQMELTFSKLDNSYDELKNYWNTICQQLKT